MFVTVNDISVTPEGRRGGDSLSSLYASMRTVGSCFTVGTEYLAAKFPSARICVEDYDKNTQITSDTDRNTREAFDVYGKRGVIYSSFFHLFK